MTIKYTEEDIKELLLAARMVLIESDSNEVQINCDFQDAIDDLRNIIYKIDETLFDKQ
jgi:hypothetical protein